MSFGARLLGDGSDHLPATKFVVKVHGSLHWEMVTALNRRWLKKPLIEGLVAPALRAYFKADVGAKRCEPKDVRIEVNGVVEDGKKRTEESQAKLKENAAFTLDSFSRAARTRSHVQC